MTPRLILLEFNELSAPLIERFMAEGHLPNFFRLRNESRVVMTHAEEEEPYLEPWIQWVTVHCGLNYHEHGVFHLNEGHKCPAKNIWELVSDRGLPVWVCGSMNVRAYPGLKGNLLPDPWCTTIQPTPRELAPFFRFVQLNVLEHTNERVPLSAKDYRQFLTFMASHGLSAKTATAIARQLVDERGRDTRWKRVPLLDLLQFDVFEHYYRKIAPVFSTFFLNSTAHYQHAYWKSFDPGAFGEPELEGNTIYRDAILFGYQAMDRLIGRFLQLAGSDTTLVLATALSQEPWVDHKTNNAAAFYRPKDFQRFVDFAGVGPCTVAPVMTEQFYLEFHDVEHAEIAIRKLATMTMDGAPVIARRLEGQRVFAGCSLHGHIASDARIDYAGRSISFFDLFYHVPTAKTAKHHPDGLFWIRTPDRRHSIVSEPAPLASVAPTLLNLLGVDAPDYMRAPVV